MWWETVPTISPGRVADTGPDTKREKGTHAAGTLRGSGVLGPGVAGSPSREVRKELRQCRRRAAAGVHREKKELSS